MMDNCIDVVLGTMTFGEQIFETEAEMIVRDYLESGCCRLDTAYVYNEGQSEKIIGNILKKISREKVLIDTKVNPRVTGKLDAEAMRMQLEESLKRLGTDHVDILYLHFPDKTVPLEEMLNEADTFHKRGMIRELGLSNYPSEMVERACEISQNNGLICPTVYEGLYNPLSRKAEALNTVLDKHGIRFYCYNPLAGGILTNKYKSFKEGPSKGRFTFRPNYQNRYWKESFFEAKELINSKCKDYDITITEATFRWLSHSSMLKGTRGDGIIIGVSKPEHLKANIAGIRGDILPKEIADSFDIAWEICREDAPEYFRFL